MKTYTQQEREQAMDALPVPVSDFLKSDTITNIYVGIGEKLNLNYRQVGLASQITNVTLLGLEPEHALETNIHQALPELSNTATRELVADINDRIFKEVQRRIKENIIEKKTEQSEYELSLRPTDEELKQYEIQETVDSEHPVEYEELLKLAEQEKAERKAKEDAEEAEAEKKRLATTPPTPEETVDAPTSSIVAEKLGLVTDVPIENKKNEEKILKTAPTETQNSVPLKSKLTEPTKPVYKGGVDPYREPVE
ncbi:MAG: hypothetical protein Greene07147_423 [Parcubacteria group bacterium Greene0714_7]|nr:MAG: hypothetical protein Greene07147_423 [Parcubacteria group bacterium Greene0714_7]